MVGAVLIDVNLPVALAALDCEEEGDQRVSTDVEQAGRQVVVLHQGHPFEVGPALFEELGVCHQEVVEHVVLVVEELAAAEDGRQGVGKGVVLPPEVVVVFLIVDKLFDFLDVIGNGLNGMNHLAGPPCVKYCRFH